MNIHRWGRGVCQSLLVRLQPQVEDFQNLEEFSELCPDGVRNLSLDSLPHRPLGDVSEAS